MILFSNKIKNKKYHLDFSDYKTVISDITGESIRVFRIISDSNFDDVIKNSKGGYIQSEKNLSRFGNCWVYDNAMVFDSGKLIDNAKIYNNVIISGNTILAKHCKLFGNINIKLSKDNYLDNIDNNRKTKKSLLSNIKNKIKIFIARFYT